LSTNTSFDDVYPCGPIPKAPETFAVPSSGPYVHFFEYGDPDGHAGFQCIELANRFLWVADGLQPISGTKLDGYDYVDTEVSAGRVPSKYRIYNADDARLHVPYLPGDVVSFSGYHGDGHVAVVIGSTYTKAGGGTYTVVLMEEDASPAGQTTAAVKDWEMQKPAGSDVTPYDFLEMPSPKPAPTWTAIKAPLPANAVSTYLGGTQLLSVACTSAASCVAVGGYYTGSSAHIEGLLLTESGTTWKADEARAPAGAASNPVFLLFSVACPSGSWCVAVGYYTDSAGRDQAVMVTGSGTKWTVTKAPVPGGGAADLSAALLSVACQSATNCVAVGSYEQPSGSYQGLVVTGSGTKWKAVKAPLPDNANTNSFAGLNSVACPSASSCTAVGNYDDSSSQQGLLLTRSGTIWKPMQAPAPGGTASGQVSLASVTCPSTSWCVTAGIYEDSAQADQGLLLTRSGTQWNATKAPLPHGAAADPDVGMASVTCASASSCTAVGYYIDSESVNQGWLMTWSGRTWTATKAPVPTAYTAVGLNTVACASASACVAAGYYDNSVGFPGLILTGSGPTWKPTEAPMPPGADSASPNVGLYAGACPSASACVVVGRYEESSGNWQALLLAGPG
jgi:hypothetical protein